MEDKCSICGSIYEIYSFKSGCVCEDCLDYLKDFTPDSEVCSIDEQAPYNCYPVKENVIKEKNVF